MAAVALILAAALASSPAVATEPLKVERVVVLMRHGVRPPTRALPAPEGVAQESWPAWSVPWGHLTPHGAEAVRLLGATQRKAFAAQGVLAASGCPAPGVVEVYADSDERTIRTGEAFVQGLAPGCGLTVAHKPEGAADPVFSPIGDGAVDFDPAAAAASVRARRPTVAQRAAEVQPLLDRLQAIVAPACAAPVCRIKDAPTRLAPTQPKTRPRLEGGLDVGSTLAQVLLLQYAEGKPMREVGWGRATAADVARLSALHALEFDLLARDPYVSPRNIAFIAARVATALSGTGPAKPKLSVIVGHDTNVASLAGLLDVHWTVPGYAADDPSPGGALVLERVADGRGRRFVRAFYLAQTLDDLRALAPTPPVKAALVVPGCAAPCPAADFLRLLAPATRLAVPAGDVGRARD